MDVSVLFMFILTFGGLTMQYPQNVDNMANTENIPITLPTNQIGSSPSPPQNCTTAKNNLPGSCVDRQLCDFSTPAIDSTLFVPKGYKKICSGREVCCPFESQILPKTGNLPNPNFDEDQF